jgi:signal transduction histidine kinase
MDGFDSLDKRLEVEQLCPFYSDPLRLKILLNNLLSNSIKYRSQFVQPFILMQVTVDNDRAVLVFTDNGKGIAKDNINRVFDMFFRASTSSTGSGLGLYIVKEAIQALEGIIVVESELGKGTTFRVELPNSKRGSLD